MPADTTAVEVSPNGKRVAALHPGELVFYRRDSGKELGRVALTARSQLISWIAPRRLIVTPLSFEAEESGYRSAITVVNPVRRTIIRQRMVHGTVIDIDRRKGLQVVLLSRGFPSSTSLHALVLDQNGHTVHDIDLPDAQGSEALNGDLVLGTSALNPAGNPRPRPPVYHLDVEHGTTFERTVDAGNGDWAWEHGTGSRYAIVGTGGGHPRAVLDRTTLEVVRTFGEGDFNGAFIGDPRGYIVLELGRTVAYRMDGTRRWARNIEGCADCSAVIGRYVYLQRSEGSRRWVTVLDARTGKTVGERDGAFTLRRPLAGRSYAERTQMSGYYALPGS
jgi:hypothetical protein